MKGIDVSNNNGKTHDQVYAIDLTGVDFAFVKSTQSTTFTDSTFHIWRTRLGEEGVMMGAYHFACPESHSAKDEAEFFIKQTNGLWGEIAPALDFESRKGVDPLSIMGVDRAARWIDEFNDRVSQAVQREPFFYSFRSYAKVLVPVISERWRLWLSVMEGKVMNVTEFAGRKVTIEQWGIVDGVDRNESYLPLIQQPNQQPTNGAGVGDEDMVMLRRESDGFTVLVTGDKWVHITEGADVWNIAASGVKFANHLSDSLFKSMTKSLGVPVEP